MRTPLYDFVCTYAKGKTTRLHMPGHKGKTYLGPEAIDITEIAGADELSAPTTVLAESERNAMALFGTGRTLYSTEGSSHAVRTMIFLAKQIYAKNDRFPLFLAARNAHKSFLYALAICDCDVIWMYPAEKAENSVAAGQPTPQTVQKQLQQCQAQHRMPIAVFVTSPDYLGQQADIRGIAQVCSSFDLPLLVDNAHGAYLHFLPEKQHPMDLGAAMCSDSAHKTLPVLTGGAYLHLNRELAGRADGKAAMELTGTTSPSYLILASLDLCNRTLAETYPDSLGKMTKTLTLWKRELRAEGIPVLESEPMKLVVDGAAMGYTGEELGEALRRFGVEPEFCDVSYLVGMLTPDNTPKDLKKTAAALRAAHQEHRAPKEPFSLHLPPLCSKMTVREAVFAPHETVSAVQSVGRICGSPTVSCPPAIPIAVSGEIISKALLPIFQAYHITNISVVKE